MRVLHVTLTASRGGAGIAVRRICEAQSSVGLSRELVVSGYGGIEDQFVNHVVNEKHRRLRSKAESALLAVLRLRDGNFRSLGVVPSGDLPRLVKSLHPDLVNLHWIGGGLLASWQIPRLGAPTVWTLHDLWPISGALHYPVEGWQFLNDESKAFFASQTSRRSRALDRMLRMIKLASSRNVTYVATSTWVSAQLVNLGLEVSNRVRTIPVPVPTHVFQPLDKDHARGGMGIGHDRPHVGFIQAARGGSPIKGSHLLPEIMSKVWQEAADVQLVMVGGQTEPSEGSGAFANDAKVWSMPTITSESGLVAFYNAMDLIIVPSLLDAFNQVAAEAIACGTPVIAFDNTGPASVVVPNVGGKLVPAYDTDRFSRAVLDLLTSSADLQRYRNTAPRHAQRYWSYQAVGKQYQDLYLNLAGGQRGLARG